MLCACTDEKDAMKSIDYANKLTSVSTGQFYDNIHTVSRNCIPVQKHGDKTFDTA